MKPSTAKAWAIFIIVISGLALLFFGVNYIYGISIGISLFSNSTAGIIALIACIVFWISLYANAIFGRKSMVLSNCAIVSPQGVERWIRNTIRLWNSEIHPGQFIVPRRNFSRIVSVEYSVGSGVLKFRLGINADFKSDTVLSRFAPCITGPNHIDRSIEEKVKEILFEMLRKKGNTYERYNSSTASNQQAAFDHQVQSDLQDALNLVGLKLREASFATS
jgi:hypothetical protein